MRIIAGERGGLRLSTIKGDSIRPTTDKIRGAIFSSLYSMQGIGGSFIDCFCGSGAMAIEALSRGYDNVYAFDSSKKSIAVIEKNLKLARYEDKIHLYKMSAKKGLTKLGEDGIHAETIFMDPPYKKLDLIYPLFDTIDNYQLAAPSGIVVIEHDKNDKIDKVIGNFSSIKEKVYGNTAISFYSR